MEFRMPTAGIATVFQEILDDYTQYEGGVKPSTNLIIHGHTMKSGMMFGGLRKYAGKLKIGILVKQLEICYA